VEKYLDLPVLWEIGSNAPELDFPAAVASHNRFSEEIQRARIGVIRDTAFQFYYPDNLEALEQQGASLREINALRDKELPDIDALYIGGGFPETQAAELAANERFCRSVKAAAENGLPIYAECGGLIYLGRSLTVKQKRSHASVLPIGLFWKKAPGAWYCCGSRDWKSVPDKGVIIKAEFLPVQ
jgi:cobyrinic acid a,c-diamide synthase